ncbi:hypothetical protein VIGAN_06000100 [Vigna angularis var. angularis]|uniref:CRM domain-containing protein n=2 Tax=Vigna angularis var. angularis TaxID=157739 RepID=A0A0S3S8I2_PHAAN|nr:hypothetical protein VIGAN_06000100 [Vigna angularis var. angularis]
MLDESEGITFMYLTGYWEWEIYFCCTQISDLGRDGLTHNMLENIHTYWMRSTVCKIKCRGVCTVDMDNVCQ